MTAVRPQKPTLCYLCCCTRLIVNGIPMCEGPVVGRHKGEDLYILYSKDATLSLS